MRMLKEESSYKCINGRYGDPLCIAAKNAGLSGVVCSVWEAERIHRECGTIFLR
jgi:orotidine-5'-phosphate decarboxylase